MITVRYSRFKLAFVIALFAGIGWFGHYAFEHGRHRWIPVGVAMMGLAAITIFFALRYFLSPKIMTMDVRGLTHYAPLFVRKAAWHEVGGIDYVPTTGAFISTAKLQVRGPFGLFRRFEFFEFPLGGDLRTIPAVVVAMDMARQGRLPVSRPAAPRPAPSVKPAPSAEPAPPAPMGFGRKGVS